MPSKRLKSQAEIINQRYMQPTEPSEHEPSAIRETALGLLSRRDHSDKELSIKLLQRGFAARLIENVIADLTESGLHSEQRYANNYARMRALKAYGPLRIRAELAERGVNRKLINRAVESLDVDFSEQARVFYQRKYRRPVENDREKARRSQAMARRGFATDHLKGLFD